MKQGTNMIRVLHYGKKINMSFLSLENEPESMYSSWNQSHADFLLLELNFPALHPFIF